MIDVTKMAGALRTLDETPADRCFIRVTPIGVLAKAIHLGGTIRLLHFTDRPYRYTRAGVSALYAAEDLDTACCEFAQDPIVKKARDALAAVPMVAFSIQTTNLRLLDLTRSDHLTVLQTSTDELTAAWRHLSTPTSAAPTQQLGRAIFEDGRFHGLIFWSAVARKTGMERKCVAVFEHRLSATAAVEISDKSGRWLERWPPP